jgi:hypothetical protein
VSSSKSLLSGSKSYGRRIVSGRQVIPLLTYKIHGDLQFQEQFTELLPTLKRFVNRYLRGSGHPQHPRIDALVDPSTNAHDSGDPSYRARRFVKLLSGLSLLPPDGTKFSVCFLLTISLNLHLKITSRSMLNNISLKMLPSMANMYALLILVFDTH